MEDIAKQSQTGHGNYRASPVTKYPNTTREEPPQNFCVAVQTA